MNQIITVNGKQIKVKNSESGGMIIKCNFYSSNSYSSYIGSISNFDNDFVGEIDLMDAIKKTIETKYPATEEVIVSRYYD